jgi:predicted amino acid-binding ACT domain protein
LTHSPLVIGLITTVGTEVNGVIKDIKDQLAFFHYEVEEIVVSQMIISQFESKVLVEWPSEFDFEKRTFDSSANKRKDKNTVPAGSPGAAIPVR